MEKNDAVTYTLDNSTTTDVGNLFYNNNKDTMYYTTSTGTVDTITIDTTSNFNLDRTSVWDTYSGYFKSLKEFEDTMPELTKIKEMCRMYPALDKAFENFKAVYKLVKDDYEAKRNNDS